MSRPQLAGAPQQMGAIQLAEDLEALNRAEIERLQTRNLAAVVAAALRTPSLRRRWPMLEQVSHARDLVHLPLMTPAELAELCPPYSNELLLEGPRAGWVVRSSGTSGRRKILYHSWEFALQVAHLGVRGVRRALVDPPRRMANCLLSAELNGGFLFAHEIGRALPALTFPFGNSLKALEAAEIIAENEIDTLVSSPGYATSLLSGAPASQFQSLRNLLYIGESLGEASKQAIAAVAPNLKLRSLAYSTSETGPVGYQCPHVDDTTHHVHDDAVIVEVVDESTGQPVPDGEAGEVVITPLVDTGMALYRYRIGDRGLILTEPCPCGSQSRLLKLLGRVAQSITVDALKISSDLLMSRLAELGVTDSTDCQLQVLWTGDTYMLKLLLSPRAPPGLSTQVVEQSLRGAYHFDKILSSRLCTGFAVERVEPARFARAASGKTPLLLTVQTST